MLIYVYYIFELKRICNKVTLQVHVCVSLPIQSVNRYTWVKLERKQVKRKFLLKKKGIDDLIDLDSTILVFSIYMVAIFFQKYKLMQMRNKMVVWIIFSQIAGQNLIDISSNTFITPLFLMSELRFLESSRPFLSYISYFKMSMILDNLLFFQEFRIHFISSYISFKYNLFNIKIKTCPQR